MKKLLSLALASALCLSLIVPASAYDTGRVGQASTVSISGEHMGMVDANGSLWMGGNNTSGQLGNGTQENSTKFIKVMDDVRTISCGNVFTAAVKTDGSLWMWGYNDYGALTGDVQEVVLRPKKVMDDVVSVSCGFGFTAAIKTDGSLWMWGDNSRGQLGNGTTKGSIIPVQVLENVAAVSCGGFHTAAIQTDGSLWTWGDNQFGALGSRSMDGNTHIGDEIYCQTSPRKVMDGVTAVCSGYWGTAAIKTDSTLWVWGSNDGGQLANGSAGTFRCSPNPAKLMDNVASVSCGASHITAVTTSGTLWAWGENGCGQLGNGYTGTGYFSDGTPVQLEPVAVMENVALVTCGFSNTIIVKTDGSIWACGRLSDFTNNSNGTDVFGYPMQSVPVLLSSMNIKLASPATIAAKVGGFNDVRESDYYADAVLWAVEKKITAGRSATAFSPKTTCTTAQILTFLWRSQGEPEPTIENPFSDVKSSDYFYKAALWAHEKGLVSGTVLNGGTACTRSTTVTYLWKLAGSPSAPSATFTDVSGNADYAQAVAWAVSKNITSGTTATTFSPNVTCTRGQIVTFLYRAFAK